MVMKAVAQPKTRTIAAGEFKAKCLKLMDEVMEGNLTLIVTKRGKPVMQATAPEQARKKPFRSVWGRSPQTRVLGDIMAPLWTEEEIDRMGNIFPDD